MPPGKLAASRSGARDAQQKQQQRYVAAQAAALKKMRTEVKAAGSVITAANQPVLPPITHAIGRGSSRSKNQFDCVVSSAEHIAQLGANEMEREAKKQKKVDSKENFWANHRAPGRKAEGKLQFMRTGNSSAIGHPGTTARPCL